MRTEVKYVVGMLAAAVMAAAGTSANAGVVNVITSGGPTTNTPTNSFTVTDPDVGTYTVTVTGYSGWAASSNIYYFRNSSATTENDDTILYTVSGLDPSLGYVSAFSLGTTKITPSVGNGSTWLYHLDLSATDVTTSSLVESKADISSAFTPTTAPNGPQSIAGNFGADPVVSFLIDEDSTALTSRTVGTYNFTITVTPTGSAVPEPASLSVLGVGAAALLRSRRRR